MIKDKRIVVGLVSETNEAFVNQCKLCLFSFRENAGQIKDIPIILVTNDHELKEEDKNFFIENFSPITLVKKKRINITKTASKFNIFDAVDPSSYDVMIFLDCDTVVADSLDGMLDPILNDDYQFICRRGGETDRNCYVDIENTLTFIDSAKTYDYLGGELPKFNTGVFAFDSKIASVLHKTAQDIFYKILNSDHIKNRHMAEQCAISLACTKENIKVKYLSEVYNSWGNLEDLKILHCFKSAYKFDRRNMFNNDNDWRKDYDCSELWGKRVLMREIENLERKLKL